LGEALPVRVAARTGTEAFGPTYRVVHLHSRISSAAPGAVARTGVKFAC